MLIEVWNKLEKKARNCKNLKRISYRCSDEDLGRKNISGKEKHRKAYARIFEQQAHSNMKDRLKNFHQLQSQLKQENHEEAKKNS